MEQKKAFRTAKFLIDKHGQQEAWRILTVQAIDEHMAGHLEARATTQRALAALHNLIWSPSPVDRVAAGRELSSGGKLQR